MKDIEKNDPNAQMKQLDGKVDAINDDGDDDGGDATWGDVCRSCCCHPPIVWAMIIFRLFGVLFFLFFFILALEILGDGAQVLTGCAAGALFGDDQNPVSSLMIGILVTCLLQSSSTTTSIIVALVGAGAVSVQQGIYMVFGGKFRGTAEYDAKHISFPDHFVMFSANIGTTITNTIVAMGQLGDGDQLERAFAGATVHDMFNYLSVAIFFPLEVITGVFAKLTSALVKNAKTTDGDTRDSFVGKYIEPIGKALILVNKSVTKDVAQGGTCASYYPTVCEDPSNPTGDSCTYGLIACPKGDLPCPALFQAGATQVTDQTSGLVAFLAGITMLFICLAGVVTVLSQMLMGVSNKIIYKATTINGYIAILIGCGLTVAVQSSSITTSALTPLVGMDLIRLEQMFPFTRKFDITVACIVGSILETQGLTLN
jgi:solute carrier family 34 (sodium-dependent phosphate cotransporter)